MNATLPTRPLAATSYLWPEPLAENLRRMRAWDLPIRQVGLLFYQTEPSLAYGPDDFTFLPGLDAHAHLPLDLPWDAGPEAVWDVIARLMAKPGAAAPGSLWGGVLHPPQDPRLLEGVASLWREADPGWRLMVENIPAQDLRAHWPVIEALDLPVCLDVGHLMAFGQQWLLDEPSLPRRIELTHCYAPGVEPGRHKHLPLSGLTPGQALVLKRVLAMTSPGVPILFEVFSHSHLRESLETFYVLTGEWGMAS